MSDPADTGISQAAAQVRGVEWQEPFGIYIHWPFCASKCPYCDFNSHVRDRGVDEKRFLAAYLREMACWAELQPGLEVQSIFFGGGTPSLMQPATVAALLDAVAGHWPVSQAAEITLEANPSSVEAGRFQGYRSAGVNRVSMGFQALNDADLKALGRLHSTAEALAALDIARATFERVNFDLIYARPAQTENKWVAELRQALSMQPDHLSLYQLTIEPGTPFETLHRAGRLKVPDQDLSNRLYEVTQEICGLAGLPAYEVSNHARPGAESRHNLLYWRYGAYAGIGPGAHGRRAGSNRFREAISTIRNPEAWLASVEADGLGVAEREILTPGQQGDEALIMGLRISEGLPLARLVRLSGRRPDPQLVGELEADNLLEAGSGAAGVLRTTGRGRRLLDQVVLKLSQAMEQAAG